MLIHNLIGYHVTIRARRQTDTGRADLMILQGREKGKPGKGGENGRTYEFSND